MSDLKELRLSKNLTQKEASAILGVSLRSYKEYENSEKKVGTLKYKSMINELEKYITIDEEHGILTLDEIKEGCKNVFEEYDVKRCFLFGSYAKGKATPKSDVDLLISTDITGLKFYGLVERLREQLCKKIDLLDTRQLVENKDLIEEILKDGIKIYEQH
ncbi:MAG: nucleotidyltransferase domain-containing protein [Clostridia bacterium]|nr:nucleotidyltransferase domain-containing protein [Clostridia bacterium]MBQ7897815.1 nucleotidyltransferase domain-containing protein [Clostridia bacterium]